MMLDLYATRVVDLSVPVPLSGSSSTSHTGSSHDNPSQQLLHPGSDCAMTNPDMTASTSRVPAASKNSHRHHPYQNRGTSGSSASAGSSSSRVPSPVQMRSSRGTSSTRPPTYSPLNNSTNAGFVSTSMIPISLDSPDSVYSCTPGYPFPSHSTPQNYSATTVSDAHPYDISPTHSTSSSVQHSPVSHTGPLSASDNSFPQGAPTMPRWTGTMWAQQGQAGQQQQQPAYYGQQPGQGSSTGGGGEGQAQYAAGQYYDTATHQQYPAGTQYPTAAGGSAGQFPATAGQQYTPGQQQQQLAGYDPSTYAPAPAQFTPGQPGYDVYAQPYTGAGAHPPPGPWPPQAGMPQIPGGIPGGSAIPGAGNQAPPPQRACVRCKRLKVRCETPNGSRPCTRCRKAGMDCETAQRKQRPKKADKERMAAEAAAAAVGRRVGDGRANVRETGSGSGSAEESDEDWHEDDEDQPEINNDEGAQEQNLLAPSDFIHAAAKRKVDKQAINAGASPGQPTSPSAQESIESALAAIPLAPVPGSDKLEILGILTSSEISRLFKLFMDKCNPYMSMFDEKIHTLESIKTRSPFLLTVMVMIASRFYKERQDAYVRLVELTKKLAGDAIVTMTRSIEHCQAFILLASYPAPDRKYSENRNWLYSGVAFRMATDLGLYKPQSMANLTEQQEREALNRTRTWIVCFYLDESMSAHFGRPATIARDDPVVKNAVKWWQQNCERFAHPHDVHLVVFVQLLRAFRNALDKVQEQEATQVDYERICREFDQEVSTLVAKSEEMFQSHSDRTTPVSILRERMGAFTTQYSRLIIHSTAFQKGQHPSPESEQLALQKSLESAFRVLDILVKDIAATSLLTYACDGYFWYASFASAFLLKFLAPEHHDKVDERTRQQIVDRVRELSEMLRDIAVDPSHPPKLFSRFLNGMLSKHVKQSARAASSSGGSSAPTPHRIETTRRETGGTQNGNATDSSFSPSTVLSDGTFSTPATSPVTTTTLSPAVLTVPVPTTQPHIQTELWVQQSQQPSQPLGTFLAGYDGTDSVAAVSSAWSAAQANLMQDVDIQELHTGMFILNHPSWWSDPSLGMDLSQLAMADPSAGGTAIPQPGAEASQFAAFDPTWGQASQ